MRLESGNAPNSVNGGILIEPCPAQGVKPCMMSRSRWKVPLCCPRCFETGEAILSHDHEGLADIRVEFLAPAFRVIPSDRTPDRVDVLCEHCKVSARRDFRERGKIWRTMLAKFRDQIPKFSGQPQKIAGPGHPATKVPLRGL